MIKNFGRLRENKKVKRIASRLFLLMIMVMICSYFSSKKALAFIYAVAAGDRAKSGNSTQSRNVQ